MEKYINKLNELEANIHAYNHALSVISLDAVTAAPKGSAKDRGPVLAVLSETAHNIFINPEVQDLLLILNENKDKLDDITAGRVQKLLEDYNYESKIPTEEFVNYQILLNDADSAWRIAKDKSDFSIFESYLEKIVEANIRHAGYFNPDKAPYDVLLERYEKGFTTKELDEYFSTIKKEIVPLVKSINGSSNKINDSFLYKEYPIHKQAEFSEYLMDVLCINKDYCSIAETEHPFTMEFNKHDVRLTTHYHKNSISSSMYSVIHEEGHALYELNTGDNLIGTCLACGTSMGIHESQSRFFENILGRSPEFIEYIFPKICEIFPEQMEGVTAKDFWLAINKSQPSLIRIEADELTYSLHIMVRYEIEKKLISGEAKVKDLPQLWNAMIKEYLGIEVPSDSTGVLQDSHWSGGLFGYFPSYSLGSAYGAQILKSMENDIDVFSLVKQGNLLPIVEWLTEKIYKYGSLLQPKEVLYNCCNAEFDPKYYIDYLKNKFSLIYSL